MQKKRGFDSTTLAAFCLDHIEKSLLACIRIVSPIFYLFAGPTADAETREPAK
jgi:hypothetical protein